MTKIPNNPLGKGVLYELNKKQELHFDIDITHERCDDGNFTASLKFRATDPDATLNETLCFLLEQFSSERSWRGLLA